jgi:trans-2,3-dihydro-3-hydroxyanthranilate isomerase
MKLKYYICDVFTDQRFGGNQLAVLPDARGLNDTQMQQIAREFNFSESTFVFPADEGHTRKVQIFTPTREVPFAGHPNIGTAFVLATCGELGTFPPITIRNARMANRPGRRNGPSQHLASTC